MPWERDVKETCSRCFRFYQDDEEDDSHGTGLCWQCFEVDLEEFEEERRRRIAEENEY
jgi:hypothetical protein